jgi:hypothetical protein
VSIEDFFNFGTLAGSTKRSQIILAMCCHHVAKAPKRFSVAAINPVSWDISSRIIHDAWASKLRTLVSLGYCSKFVVSTVHPRREIGESAKTCRHFSRIVSSTKPDACRRE